MANKANVVSDAQIEQARQVNLVDYLQHYDPGELKRIGQSWTLKSHDSMRISADGRWNWFSQGIGGGDAISYLQKVHNMSFQDAVLTLSHDRYPVRTDMQNHDKQPEHKPFELPPKHTDNRRVFAYLRSRGIDPEIINHCFKHGDLYEDAKHHNAVFVGRDESGTVKYASLRSTITKSTFRIEQAGSDKSYGFTLSGKGSTLYVCEAAIDALSVATLRKIGGRDWRQGTYIALGGVTSSKEKLPAALERALKNSSFKWVVLALDNDIAGQTASKNIYKLLQAQYPSAELKVCVPNEKDFNDQLRVKLASNGKPPPSRGTREMELS